MNSMGSSLLQAPADVLQCVLERLDVGELVTMAETCRRVRSGISTGMWMAAASRQERWVAWGETAPPWLAELVPDVKRWVGMRGICGPVDRLQQLLDGLAQCQGWCCVAVVHFK